MISWQAWMVKLFLRFTVKRQFKRPAPSPQRAIARLRRSLSRFDGYNRRITRGLKIRYVTGGVRGEWLLPDGEPTSCAILYVHGGGYVACSPLSHRPLTTALARASGVPVFSLDYRLAPEHPFPAALDDVVAAFDAIRERGIAAERIVLAGDSAGGGLVLSAGLALRGRGTAPGGIVAYSPWTDLAATGASLRRNAWSDDMLVGSGVAQSARSYARGDADVRDPLASPLYGDLAGYPPALVFASTSEVLLDDAVRFVAKARATGAPVELVKERWMPHVWAIFVDVMPEARRTIAQSAGFIRGIIAAAPRRAA